MTPWTMMSKPPPNFNSSEPPPGFNLEKFDSSQPPPEDRRDERERDRDRDRDRRDRDRDRRDRDRPDRSERTDRTDRPERTDRTDRADRPDRADRRDRDRREPRDRDRDRRDRDRDRGERDERRDRDRDRDRDRVYKMLTVNAIKISLRGATRRVYKSGCSEGGAAPAEVTNAEGEGGWSQLPPPLQAPPMFRAAQNARSTARNQAANKRTLDGPRATRLWAEV
ncbi:unnamed protein product [Leptidea sinapis]|uniref:Uncharacterized protein n=1 Tax=Leptidea sinapis TaxID=189913 RepID=A0A5E4QLW4_9NEOP|nr:unnamed protein product [Leptidea sinapis]